ncbi:alpha/beta hydrolase [Roseococcus sp. YIM B11640]|uniref:alpha/beta hydrolase n=1 Tax=Roseococcus sp. YIM B11640 TaxID=3133973 RepID=UPI003C7B9CA6
MPTEEEIARLPALAAWAEAQYNLRARHPERETIYADYTARSEKLRGSAHWECLRYAAPERCTIDFFPAARADAPLLVFIHGGFWRSGDKRVFSFLAEPYAQAGVAVALVGYELAPQVTLTRIVEQMVGAWRFLVTEATGLGINPARITLSGHSAGGHLSALLSTMDPGLPHLHGVLPISGIFDLAPMLLTSINHESRITAEEAVTLSPALKSCFRGRRYWVVAGAGETEDFIAQTQRFGAMMEAACPGSGTTLVPGRHHFDIFEDFADPASPVFREALALITSMP